MNLETVTAIIFSIVILLVMIFSPLLFFAFIDFLGTKRFLFIKPIEGRFLYVVRGSGLKRIVYSIKGWELNKNDKMVKDERAKGWLETTFGVQWLGIPFIDSVFEFPLSWDELGKKKDEAGYSTISHADETVDGLFFQATYVLQLHEAETAGQIPLNARIILTLRRNYPERAAFKLGTPAIGLSTVNGLALNQARKVVRTLDINKVLGLGSKNAPTENAADQIIEAIYQLNINANLSDVLTDVADDEVRGALSNITGCEVVSVSIESIEPALSSDELAKLRAVPLAEIQGDAVVALAQRQKEADTLYGQGQAGALKAQADVMEDPNARDLAIMQLVRDSNLLTLGGDAGMQLFVQAPTQTGKKEGAKE